MILFLGQTSQLETTSIKNFTTKAYELLNTASVIYMNVGANSFAAREIIHKSYTIKMTMLFVSLTIFDPSHTFVLMTLVSPITRRGHCRMHIPKIQRFSGYATV
mmetsp:Transcript_10404/g.11882  ORF Transcript_10404/g.11882 Transcript_10404/m.11882 type:complete len:104 (-) Transcript_10404:350-661(-)